MKKLTPFVITMLLLIVGLSLLVSGIYLLAGTGFALLAASSPFLITAGVLIRGLTRV